METTINLLGISSNSYVASFTECFLIVTCGLWPAKETCRPGRLFEDLRQ